MPVSLPRSLDGDANAIDRRTIVERHHGARHFVCYWVATQEGVDQFAIEGEEVRLVLPCVV